MIPQNYWEYFFVSNKETEAADFRFLILIFGEQI